MLAVFFLLSLLAVLISVADPAQRITHRRAHVLLFSILALLVWQASTFKIAPGSDLYTFFSESLHLSSLSPVEAVSSTARDPGYALLGWGIMSITPSPLLFSAAWPLLTLTGTYLGLRCVLRPWQLLLTLFLLISLPIFFGYLQVAVRQGVALGLLAFALGHGLAGKRAFLYAGALAAPLLHWSALPFSAALFIACSRYRTVGVAAATWVLSATLFVFGEQLELLEPLTDSLPVIENYASPSVVEAYGGTNRVDFFLVSLLGACAGLWLHMTRSVGDTMYDGILTYYLLANAAFLLFGFVAFSDRIAVYSWYMLPLLLVYPLLASHPRGGWEAPAICIGSLIVGVLFGSYSFFV